MDERGKGGVCGEGGGHCASPQDIRELPGPSNGLFLYRKRVAVAFESTQELHLGASKGASRNSAHLKLKIKEYLDIIKCRKPLTHFKFGALKERERGL